MKQLRIEDRLHGRRRRLFAGSGERRRKTGRLPSVSDACWEADESGSGAKDQMSSGDQKLISHIRLRQRPLGRRREPLPNET